MEPELIGMFELRSERIASEAGITIPTDHDLQGAGPTGSETGDLVPEHGGEQEVGSITAGDTPQAPCRCM